MRVIILFAFVATLHSTFGSECGGVVEVGTGETVIEYLPPGGYKDSEFCVWTLLPTVPYSGWTIDYVAFGVEDKYDGVVIYNWGDDGIITTSKIEPSNSNSTTSLSKPFAAIAFSSDYRTFGQGFQVIIKGTGQLRGDFNCRGFFFNQIAGNFSYPEDFGVQNYKPNERVAVVLHYKVASLTRLYIDFTDIQDDPLMVYHLEHYGSGGGPSLLGMTNGSNPEGVPSLTSRNYYPRLLLFHSNDNSKTGKGFVISWETNM